jgi:hypothetical protein
MSSLYLGAELVRTSIAEAVTKLMVHALARLKAVDDRKRQRSQNIELVHGGQRTARAWVLSGCARPTQRSNDSPRSITMHGGRGFPWASTTALSRLASTFRTCIQLMKFSVSVASCDGDFLCDARPLTPTIPSFRAVTSRR